MAGLEQIEKLLADVGQRLQGIEEGKVGEKQIREIFSAMMEEALKDPEIGRKMRFDAKSPEILQGSKFARWNLGVADIEFLFDMQSALKGQRKVDGDTYAGPSQDLENAFKAISDACYLSQDEIRKIDRQAIDGMFPRVSKSAMKSYERALKAMDSAESGFGNQLIGSQYVGELWEAARRESRIFNQLTAFEMTAPSAYLPVEVDFPEMQYVGESTADYTNGSDYGTSKTGSQRVQVDAKKFVIHQMWSGELEEDSIIPFVPFLRMQAAKAIAHYTDSLVLNGDTTNAATGNINLVDTTPGATKHYLAFDGIRHAYLVDNTGNAVDAGGAITYTQLTALRSKMVDAARFVDWGHPSDPNDLIYVADVETADRIAELSEVLTMDKYGQNASILNGEVSKIGKNPLLVSMAMSKTDATGAVSNTAGNNVKGGVAAFNRKGFVPGWRRRVKLEVERIPGRDQTRLVYSMRMGLGRFTPTGAASGIEAAAGLYNITL